jgi:hypothetical protein
MMDSASEENKDGGTKVYPLNRVTHEKVKYIESGFKGW